MKFFACAVLFAVLVAQGFCEEEKAAKNTHSAETTLTEENDTNENARQKKSTYGAPPAYPMSMAMESPPPCLIRAVDMQPPSQFQLQPTVPAAATQLQLMQPLPSQPMPPQLQLNQPTPLLQLTSQAPLTPQFLTPTHIQPLLYLVVRACFSAAPLLSPIACMANDPAYAPATSYASAPSYGAAPAY